MAVPFTSLETFKVHIRSIFCILFIFLISLFKSRFFDFLILQIFFGLLLGQILSIVIVLINLKFQSLDDKYKWVRREWMLLKALIEDVECVSKSVNERDDKALRLWSSEPSLGVTLQLNQYEEAWLEITKEVVHVAESCVKSYQRLTERRQFPTWSYSIFWDWINIKNLHFEIDRVKDGIENLFMSREESFRHICGSLERSRSIVRNLQDRPIGGEDESFVYKRAGPTLSLSSNNLIGTTPNLVLLNLLLKFLRDLEGHRFDSETEKAWVKEAEELIGELQRETESNSLLKLLLAFLTDLEGLLFKRETEQAWVKEAVKITGIEQRGIDFLQKLANPRRWFSYFKNLMARRKLTKSCNCTETLLHDLFQRKILFGFSFIRREPPKSVCRSPHQLMFSAQAIDDMGIVPLLAIINRCLPPDLPATASHQITQLHNQFEEVHKLLMEEKAVGGKKHIMACSDQLKNLVKDAENSLRSYRQRQSSAPNETDPWLKFSAEVRGFKHTLSLIELSIKVCRTERREEKNMVVGLEDDIHKVASQLITSTSTAYTVSIVGMTGIGKTTLANIIYNRGDIRDHFNHRAWASIPDTVADDDLLKIVGKQVLKTDEERNERHYWIEKLRDFLSSGMSLLVLDNITSVEVWNTLKETFPETPNGSRILLTTRYRRVASQSGVQNQLRLRTKEQSWSLFQQMVDLQPELSHEVNTLASKVVGRCGGLPLLILHLGYLMSGKKLTLEELLKALEHINHVQTPWLEILEINEKDSPLNQRLKQCLSYFAYFPRDSEISARRLTTSWVAEWLTVYTDDQQSEHEELAEKYLLDLIDRNLIQLVEQNLDGKVKTCSFPGALQDLWQQDNTNVTRYPSSRFDQRLVCHFDENEATYMDSYGSSINSPDIWGNYGDLRSFLFFDAQKRYNSGKKIGSFLDRGIARGHLLQLQILDLEHVFRPQLPKSIRKLRHLTYLGLRWTYLETIPSSIGKLVNLETLDIKHTYIRILPISIWGLPKLKHLYLNDIHQCEIEVQPSQNFLQNLQILQNAFVDQSSLRRNRLDRLNNLRKLSLAFKLNPSEQSELEESLVKLTQLQSLKLKSIDERGKPNSLMTMQLSTLENLSSLYLFGKLVRININILPQRLTDLTLSASGLATNPMKELEKLSSLKSLSFYSHSYAGTRISCSNGGFPQLLVLKFWMLSKLKRWKIQRRAMPNLKQLEIQSCQNLKVPIGFRNLKTLRKLKLKDMPKRFTEKIEKTKDQIWGAANSAAIIVDVQ